MASLAIVACAARADHEAPFYPSFYPQEIRIEALDSAAAADGWTKARVHAYVGDDPFATGAPPADATAVESLGSFVVLTFDPSPGRSALASADARRDAARHVVRSLNANVRGFVRHPYPVTPWHADYLDYADLAADAKARDASSDSPAFTGLRVRAIGALATALVPAVLKADSNTWDATLESVDVAELAATERAFRLASPWVRQGWFQAHALLRERVSGDAASRSDAAYRRLVSGDYRDRVERIHLERALVSSLLSTCERTVIGYSLRREYFASDYSRGIENIGFDAQSGFASRIFSRTAKLKDFPWNGWLRIGTPRKSDSAWNPIGGMSDSFARLVWFAMSDSPLLPDPYGGSWIANRVSVAPLGNGRAVPIPADALLPGENGGRWRKVGTGKTAPQALRYSVVTSRFHSGTMMDEADILYPYVFAPRAGLAGIRVSGTRTFTRNFGDDLKFTYPIVVVDVYLTVRSDDPWEAAAIAPPWSTLPWEVLVLMEEADKRGIAALSQEDARRRAIPWLDLVRDHAMNQRLVALVDRFRDERYRPAAITSLVGPDDARARWSALRAFYARHGHFLVTNGPYRLDSWSDELAVLAVFRDPSYPQGVGTFDDYAIPRRAYVAKVDDLGDRLEITADVERISRFQRSYELSRVRVEASRIGAPDADRPECHYVVISADSRVVRAGIAPFGPNGRYAIDLRKLPGSGPYRVALAMLVAPNRVNAETMIVVHPAVASAGRVPERRLAGR
ncbi:MAG TPA: hypothetical protein VJ891_08270 [Casimicrobiaceae bacterium]|nr:hypothetical protein [Casimicrobiaceae bacterium]